MGPLRLVNSTGFVVIPIACATHRFIMKTILAILFFCVVATLAEPINEKRGFKRCRSHGDCGNANQCCIGGFYCGHYAQEGHLCTLSSAFACGCAPGLDCVKTGFLTKRCRRNGFHSLGPLLNSPHEFHFIHSGLPSARHKRSLPHTRKLKTDPQVHRVYQQTGFRRVKRGYREIPDSLLQGPKSITKKNSWSQLRASLEDDINPDVVHPEHYFQQLQEELGGKSKRGYNALTVDNLV